MIRPRQTQLSLSPAIAILVFVFLSFTGAVPAEAGRTLLLLEPIGEAGTRDLVSDLTSSGMKVHHVFPGRAIIGETPDAGFVSTGSFRGVREVYDEGSTPAMKSGAEPLMSGILLAWNRMTGLEMEPVHQPMSLGGGPLRPLAGDAEYPPMSEGVPGKTAAPPTGADFWDTSEFFLGSISLSIILLESDGTIDPNQEDWTAAEETNVTAEVVNGMNWWVARGGEIGHTLTFFYDFYYGVNQGYEPITRPSTDNVLWSGAAMTTLGYTAYGNNFDNVRDLNNDRRSANGTDWGVTVFIMDDTIDPDNAPVDGRFAVSYSGGPYYWMTYGNDGWGIANMDMVAAHELGHSFYALDEYASSGCTCSDFQGYLRGVNRNCDAGCATNIPTCIMRSATSPIGSNVLCPRTDKQIGLRDGDLDNIPNILESVPETVLDPLGADTIVTTTATYTGSATAVALVNRNTHGQGHDITLNVIGSVEYRVDGGPWNPASAVDGAFDGTPEAFTFTTAAMADGVHIIEARAWHDYAGAGNVDPSSAVDTVVVLTATSVAAPDGAFSPGMRIAPTVAADGTTIRFSLVAGRDVNLSVFSPSGRRVARIYDGHLAPGVQEIRWNGKLTGGVDAPAGVYFVRLTTGERVETGRVVLVR